MTTRREVLQGLIVSMGGAAALTACGGVANVVATRPGSAGRFYTASEMSFLSSLSDLIIPRTETPGAVDVNVSGYMDALMTDWANDETRSSHRQDLGRIENELNQLVGGSFVGAEEDRSVRVLSELDAAVFDGSKDLEGYRRIKGYISRSYFATESGAVEELKWVSVPGRWDPSVDISGTL